MGMGVRLPQDSRCHGGEGIHGFVRSSFPQHPFCGLHYAAAMCFPVKARPLPSRSFLSKRPTHLWGGSGRVVLRCSQEGLSGGGSSPGWSAEMGGEGHASSRAWA